MTSLALPPFIMTSEESSFARNTIAVRKPLIIDQILQDNDYPAPVRKALLELKTELVSGQIRPLDEETEDKEIWDHDLQPWTGNSWLAIPWFLAETYFFRRVLEATGYFQPGPLQFQDPYAQLKDNEFIAALPQFAAAYRDAAHEKSLAGFSQAVTNALWGNQADLSNLDRGIVNSKGNPQQFLRNDTEEVFTLFQDHPINVTYFLDNVGKELYFDLALMDHLLENQLASSITVLLKNQPFFVSDVMAADVTQALARLNASPEASLQNLAHNIQDALQSERITLKAPPFLTTGRMYRQLPEALKTKIRGTDLAILKGDANYRRLVGDRHWAPTTPVGRAAGYFPTSFVSLRTLKAELLVGIEQEKFTWVATHAEKDWMTNGKWGLITFLNKRH